MSTIQTYLPLYRKYRPQSFADVVGQPALVQALSNAITMQKVAHAYLFCGPRGTGKTSTARILAKSLNCEQGPTPAPCLTCPSCTGIAAGNALDVIEFDAASHGGVDDARELIESTQFAPITGKYKIYIIDEVHMLSSQAFNALLKTLEEPPPGVVFILATTESHKVLPTIVSRCQRFDFQRVTLEALADRLRYIATQEGMKIDDEALRLIARKARGGLRDAVSQLDQVSVLGLSHPETPVSLSEASEFLGLLDESALASLLEAIVRHDTALVLSTSQTAAHRGLDPYQMLSGLIEQGRALLWIMTLLKGGEMLKANAAPSLRSGAFAMETDTGKIAQTLDLLNETATRLADLTASSSPDAVSHLLSRLARAEREMRLGQDPWLWFEVAVLDAAFQTAQTTNPQTDRPQAMASASSPPVSQPRPSKPIPQPISDQGSVVAGSPPQAPAPPPQAAPVKPAPATPAASIASDSDWEAFVKKIGSISTRSLVKDWSTFESLNDTTLILRAKNEKFAADLRSKKHQDHIVPAAKATYLRPLQVEIIVGNTPTPPSDAPAPPPTRSASASVAPAAIPPNAEPPPPEIFEPEIFEPPIPMMTEEPDATPPQALETEIPMDSRPIAPSLDAHQLANAREYTLELLQGTLVE